MDGERIPVQERSDLPVFAQALRDRKAGVEVVFTRELPGEGTNEIKATLLRAPKSELQAERRSDDDFEFGVRELTLDVKLGQRLPDVLGVVVDSVERAGWAGLASLSVGVIQYGRVMGTMDPTSWAGRAGRLLIVPIRLGNLPFALLREVALNRSLLLSLLALSLLLLIPVGALLATDDAQASDCPEEIKQIRGMCEKGDALAAVACQTIESLKVSGVWPSSCDGSRSRGGEDTDDGSPTSPEVLVPASVGPKHALSGKPCPKGTKRVGKAPPKGTSQACIIRGSEIKRGPFALWYENGQLKVAGTYLDDGRYGKWTKWTEEGVKTSEGRFEQDKKIGSWTQWYEDGTEKSSGAYTADEKKTGPWTEWNSQEKATSWTLWDEGTKIGVSTQNHDDSYALRCGDSEQPIYSEDAEGNWTFDLDDLQTDGLTCAEQLCSADCNTLKYNALAQSFVLECSPGFRESGACLAAAMVKLRGGWWEDAKALLEALSLAPELQAKWDSRLAGTRLRSRLSTVISDGARPDPEDSAEWAELQSRKEEWRSTLGAAWVPRTEALMMEAVEAPLQGLDWKAEWAPAYIQAWGALLVEAGNAAWEASAHEALKTGIREATDKGTIRDGSKVRSATLRKGTDLLEASRERWADYMGEEWSAQVLADIQLQVDLDIEQEGGRSAPDFDYLDGLVKKWTERLGANWSERAQASVGAAQAAEKKRIAEAKKEEAARKKAIQKENTRRDRDTSSTRFDKVACGTGCFNGYRTCAYTSIDKSRCRPDFSACLSRCGCRYPRDLPNGLVETPDVICR